MVSINTQLVFTNTPDSAYLHPHTTLWVLFYASKSAFAPLLVLFGTSRVLSNTVTFVIQYTYKTKQNCSRVKETYHQLQQHLCCNKPPAEFTYQCIILPIQIMHTNSTSTSACPHIHSTSYLQEVIRGTQENHRNVVKDTI